MNNIPEDSMLRRHYLTELANKKPDYTPESLWSGNVMIPLVGFLIFLLVLFV